MRRIKHLGFAVLAAFALTAIVGAATASATQFRAEEYPTTLNGTQTKSVKYQTVSGTAACTTTNMNGVLSAASASVSLTPEMKGCQAFGQAATPAANSCKYVLNSTNESEPFTGTMDIVCSKEGDAIEFKTTICTLKVPAQKGLAVSLANSDPIVRSRNRNITATVNATGIKYTLAGVLCPFVGSGGSYENGTLTGSVNLKGRNVPAEHAVGIYLANGQVDAPPLFATEGGLGAVTSDKTTMSMSIAGMSFNCTAFQVGSSGFPIAGDKLNLSVSQWSGCYFGTGFSVNPNGCSLDFQATTSEGEEAWGVLSIGCPVGKALTFTAMSGACSVSIPAQANRAKLTFKTTGTGAQRKIATQVGVTGLKYTGTGSLGFCNTGTQENGSLSSSFNLSSSGQGFYVLY